MSQGGRWFRVNTTWSQSEWLAALSPASRLAWIELIGYVKAHGYDGKVRAVSPVVFGRMFGIDAPDVSALLEAAAADGALTVAEGEWILTGWTTHQGDQTAAGRMQRYRERRGVTPVTRNDRSVTPTETETEREETTLSSSDEPNVDGGRSREPEPAGPDPVREVFDYWRERCGHPQATLTTDRRAKIRARLRTYSPEQLRKAIDAAAVSPFHQGDNERATRYDFPETIFKNDAAAERLMHGANGNGRPPARAHAASARGGNYGLPPLILDDD